METSIRFVRVNGGKMGKLKPALCFRGRKQAHAVINDETVVRVVSNIPISQHDHSAPVLYPMNPQQGYPVARFVAHFQKIGQRKGITQRARFFLERALTGGVEEDESLPPDTVEGAQSELRTAVKDVLDRKAGAASPKPAKPASNPERAPDGPSRTSGADVIRTIAAELKLEPAKLRKLLRSKGLSAPYDNETLIRSKL